MRRVLPVLLLGAVLAGRPLPAGAAIQVSLAPPETLSKDAWVYENLSTSNFDTDSLPPTGFFSTLGLILATSNTGASSAHSVKSLVEFDLSSLSGAGIIQGSQVLSATLKLRTVDGSVIGFPFANPSTSNPVVTEAFAITSSWTESGVTWDTLPTTQGSAAAAATVTAVGQTVELDLTALVKDWIDGALSNFGVLLSQQSEVRVSGVAVAAVYASSAAAEANRPVLEIVAVPEPSSLLLGCLGLVGLIGAARATRRGPAIGCPRGSQ